MGWIDRYLFGRLMGPFAFFLLVLTAVIWLAQSLRVIDVALNYGQSALVLVELAAFLLPKAMAVVIPVAALGATLYALERAMSDSEIAALFAAGASRLRTARPAILFGLGVTALLYANSLWLSPLSAQSLRSRTAEVQTDLAAALLQDGRFLHPATGVTVYLREVGRGGETLGVFVNDARDPEAPMAYHARRGAVVRAEEGPRLVMFDGEVQRVDRGTGAFSVLRFDKLAYDLSEFTSSDEPRSIRPDERGTLELLATPPDLEGRALGRWVTEAHERLASPLYGLALPLVAAAALMGGPFSRRGYGARAAAGGLIGGGLRLAGLAAKNAVISTPSLWWLHYLPPLIGILGALALLSWSGFGFRRPGAPPPLREARA
ncbi:LPS export ABC transporter permease LptF [Neomegalonema sp.]|uniref:LPS export ABC transporter permease LptF n=1 Tax=Neomegalonema sp. TaxID=2039713 RepID=UPI002635E638|nr:LPS export ABC transporter permease LptF [Neomegalonema sp.]MDD2869409.1 LPS export ABC transporter permease LptF [Neomegalonema sp.]